MFIVSNKPSILSVVMLRIVILNVVMLSNVITVLNGVMLHVVMLNVVAPSFGLYYKTDSLRGGGG